ncbi:MAG TPA: CDP-alcohol phosphatidyltransferase family protein, partial [Geminicoccaceae bacterium]|nr:CDP-alcohol phosphatidyltransferase family protein [Geminicoccaceae bacterium]
MLDARLRRLVDPALDRLCRPLAARGLPADAVTIAGFAIGVGAAAAIAAQAYLLGLGLLLLNRLFDGLDGAVARQRGLTDRGGFLDIVLDFLVYAAVPFAFALAEPATNALPAAFLVFSFVGSGTSFLAFAIMAAKRGITTELRG